MNFVFMFLFLVFLVSINVYGDRKPILYLINTILLLIIAALDFTLPGHDWVNNLWGAMMFLFAIYWGNLYSKYRKLNKR